MAEKPAGTRVGYAGRAWVWNHDPYPYPPTPAGTNPRVYPQPVSFLRGEGAKRKKGQEYWTGILPLIIFKHIVKLPLVQGMIEAEHLVGASTNFYLSRCLKRWALEDPEISNFRARPDGPYFGFFAPSEGSGRKTSADDPPICAHSLPAHVFFSAKDLNLGLREKTSSLGMAFQYLTKKAPSTKFDHAKGGDMGSWVSISIFIPRITALTRDLLRVHVINTILPSPSSIFNDLGSKTSAPDKYPMSPPLSLADSDPYENRCKSMTASSS
ncbi:hypothetical protein B0H17DRAFT_1141762 [Mycena rosella]|uniref:Uncharacterized protein n=1 Tax=Mycena rosella TaxID=1033263 RepID=A0AAD7CZD7_MYCRO|nr:hypothetical protein B0H17DRAFT_1141762 [Mycena rosella]